MRILSGILVTLFLPVLIGTSQLGFASSHCEGHLRPGMEIKTYSVDLVSNYQGRVPVPQAMNVQTAYDIVIIAGYSNASSQVIRLDRTQMGTNTLTDPHTGQRVRGYFIGVVVAPDVPVQVIWKQ